jgi:GTPase KRas
MESIRIQVYLNSKNPGPAKNILLSRWASFDELLLACCEALNGSYKLIYNENGRQIISVDGLHDGSKLYMSQGEGFQVAINTTDSKELAFVLLGSAGVGKSAVTLRYIRNLFITDYDPTLEDYYKHTTVVSNTAYSLSILDTAGMEDYEPLLDEWIDKKQAVLLVFSLELRDSLEKLDFFAHKVMVKYAKSRKPVMVVVGNKADLQRKVGRDEGKMFAEKYGCRYYEVSAATGEGIRFLFDEAVAEIVRRRRETQLPWYRRCSLL